MVGTRGYTVLGWVVWQVARRVIKRKVADNQLKLGAAAVVLLVLIGGVAAAKAAAGHD